MADGYGYGGYQGYGTPADMATRLAQAQLMEGSSTTPLQSKWQGAARLANAIMGGIGMRQAMSGWQKGQQQEMGMFPSSPAGGAAPALGTALTGGGGPNGSMVGVPNMDDASLGESIMGGGGGAPPMQGPPQQTMMPNNGAGGAPPMTAPGGGGLISNPRGTGGFPPGTGLAGLPPQGVQVASNNPNFAPFTAPPSGNGQVATDGGNLDAMLVADAQPQGGARIPPGMLAGGGNPNPQPGGSGSLMQRITSMGYSPMAAAGIVGNFGQESSLNPSSIGDGGASGGLGQWHGARFANLQAFAQQNGSDWRDPNVQLAFADREIKANPQLYQALNSAQTPQQAADIFEQGFEKAAPATANMGRREGLAAQALNGGGNDFLRNSVAGPGAPSGALQPMADQGGVPQGASGQPTGGFNMDAARQLIMNPYADPDARRMAMQMIQMYAMPKYSYQAMPNGNALMQMDQFGRPTGQMIQGPHKTSIQKIGTDMMGVDHYGVFDENTGQLIQKIDPNSPTGGIQGGASPMPGVGQPNGGGQGQQGASGAPNSVPPGNIPPPNPAWTPGASPGQPQPQANAAPKTWAPGQPIDPALDQKLQGLSTQFAQGNPQAASEVYQYAKALLQGNQQFVSAGTVAKSPIVMAAETIARQVDPDGMPQTRFDTIHQNADVSNPTSLGGQRMAAQTSVRHLGSLAEASDLLGQQGQISSSEMGAKIQDWAQRNLGGASSGFTNASQAYSAALVPVLGEIDKLYKGGQATEGEINEMKSNLSPDASPSARRAALTMLGGLLQDKVSVLQSTWHMGTGSSFPDLPIIDQQGQKGLDYIKKWGAPPAGAPAGAPAGGSANVLGLARDAISRGAPRGQVIQRLQQMGVDPSGL